MDDTLNDAFDERLMCKVVSLTYDFRSRTGRLHLSDGDCCDMTGCVRIFEGIDPGVAAIDTYSGDKADVSYRRSGAEWHFRDHRRA